MNEDPFVRATDFAGHSERALSWAGAPARDLGAPLVMLHVEPGRPTTEFVDLQRTRRSERRGGGKVAGRA
jgi:hypothetical protein